MMGVSLCPSIPVIGLDMWEHAYLPQYETNKEAYIEKFWANLKWDEISKNFEEFNIKGNATPLL
jgi:Fe-Mn family superoxide dismutase